MRERAKAGVRADSMEHPVWILFDIEDKIIIFYNRVRIVSGRYVIFDEWFVFLTNVYIHARR